MQPTQTGIATALALVVIIFFFLFNGMSLFSQPQGQPQAAAVDQSQTTLTDSSTTTTMPTDPSQITQLLVRDDIVGSGTAAAPGDSVTVNYVGALTNGTVFDASANHGTTGFTFTLGAGQVIKGWDEGIVGMKVGGKRTLVIPASLAYGAQSPSPSIPPNSPLVFEVELLKVQKAGQ